MSSRAMEPAVTPHDCPTCGALPGHQRPELARDPDTRLAAVKALVYDQVVRSWPYYTDLNGERMLDMSVDGAVAAVERIVAARLAAAWDEGHRAGMNDEYHVMTTANPYRTAVVADPADTTR